MLSLEDLSLDGKIITRVDLVAQLHKLESRNGHMALHVGSRV